MNSPITTQTEEEQAIAKIAIQGYQGAFHEIATRFYYKDKPVEIIPADTFDELVATIEKGEKASSGLMAIENTLAGSLMYNYQLLSNSDLTIVGEVYLRIKQNLMVLPGQKIEDIEEVHSHPVALVQCKEYFKQYPHIRLVEMTDTALSAKIIREGGLKNRGAVASRLAADMYNLDILAASIETNKENFTRFLVLQPKETSQALENVEKVSLSFSALHEVGSLYKVLAVLAAYNVNLTKIQSAPIIGKQWEYMFFVDFAVDGNLDWSQAIGAIRPLTNNLKILGAYPKGEHFEY